MRSRERCRKNERCYDVWSLGDDVVNNLGPLGCSVRVVDDMPRAGSHYNLGISRGPDKIGSRAGPGPRLARGWSIVSNALDRSKKMEIGTCLFCLMFEVMYQ